jgi:hypothetical protein
MHEGRGPGGQIVAGHMQGRGRLGSHRAPLERLFGRGHESHEGREAGGDSGPKAGTRRG